ncbi:MAG: glycosyltransferase [Acidobacteriota bacterium]
MHLALTLFGVLQALYTIAALLCVTILLVFNFRRILFALAIFRAPGRSMDPEGRSLVPQTWPDVLILASCRDEETMVAGLCQSLDGLDYPTENRRVLLIDDGSRDKTRPFMEQIACEQIGWGVLSLPVNLGKASALNVALRESSFGDIIYVLDADHRPELSALKTIVRCFQDPQIAGISGATWPSNALSSPTAFYSTVETLVHQLVTMRAKDRLGLAPALLGSNCAYRRDLLDHCGSFREGALLEDSDLTMSFYRAGYKVRFVPESVAWHSVPETVDGYLKQHRRWARGFADVALTHAMGLIRDRRLSIPLRLELFLFATGYLDRIALVGGIVLTFLSVVSNNLFSFPVWVLLLALVTPLFQIIALFVEQRAPAALWLRLPVVPVFYLVDILSAVQALLDSILRRTRSWTKTARSTPSSPSVNL